MRKRLVQKKVIHRWIALDDANSETDKEWSGCAWVGLYKPNMDIGLLKQNDVKEGFELLSTQEGWDPREFLRPGTTAAFKITIEIDNDRLGSNLAKKEAQKKENESE